MTGTDDKPAGSLRSRGAWAVLIVVTLLGLVSDLASKSVAFRTIAGRPVEVHREEVLRAQREGRSLGSLVPPASIAVVPKALDLSLVDRKSVV